MFALSVRHRARLSTHRGCLVSYMQHRDCCFVSQAQRSQRSRGDKTHIGHEGCAHKSRLGCTHRGRAEVAEVVSIEVAQRLRAQRLRRLHEQRSHRDCMHRSCRDLTEVARTEFACTEVAEVAEILQRLQRSHRGCRGRTRRGWRARRVPFVSHAFYQSGKRRGCLLLVRRAQSHAGAQTCVNATQQVCAHLHTKHPGCTICLCSTICQMGVHKCMRTSARCMHTRWGRGHQMGSSLTLTRWTYTCVHVPILGVSIPARLTH
eukprot:1126256-Pelagomonas_calceolata.AAC.2